MTRFHIPTTPAALNQCYIPDSTGDEAVWVELGGAGCCDWLFCSLVVLEVVPYILPSVFVGGDVINTTDDISMTRNIYSTRLFCRPALCM